MTDIIPSQTTKATLFGAIRNIGQGIYNRTAKFASYRAASPTATTRVGGRMGANMNSTISQMQRVGMNWTAEDVTKNCSLGEAYLGIRANYCSSVMKWIPATGDLGLDKAITEYLYGDDGFGGVFATMGVDCSMQDAFSRTADRETPVRGDAGLIIWRDACDNIRLIEFSADQLGEIYNFTDRKVCGLAWDDRKGCIVETSGSDCVYLSGRYFKGADCVAYKIYERTNAWYANPKIYPASDVIYFRDPASYRGVRGVTKFAVAILHMEKGEQLFQIGMDAAQRQAKTAMAVYNQNGAPDEATYESDLLIGGQTRFIERLPNAPIVEYFYNGDTVENMSADSPGPELIQGVETSDERVALALWMNYAFLVGATKVGGAPSRLEVEKANKELVRVQSMLHRPKFKRIKDITLLDAARKRLLPLHRDLLRGSLMLPISATVDAFYDGKESIDMKREGLRSPQEIIAETNRNSEDVSKQCQQWAIRIAKLTQDANKILKQDGYKETITDDDIASNTDNPLQGAEALQLAQGKPALGDNPQSKAA